MSTFSAPPSPLVRRFARNTAGRDLIVGDIHGHFTKLQAALDAVGFAPGAGDRLFSVGDLVDRGPESALALDWLARPWFHAVAGNHEDFAIRWPHGRMDPGNYVANGGGWNVANTLPERQLFADTFSVLPIAMELETADGLVGIVHAECPLPSWQEFTAALESPALSNTQRQGLIDAAQWSRTRVERMDAGEVAGVRAVVVGHTPMRKFTSLGNTLYIDTGAWLPQSRGAGFFTILDAETLRPAAPPSQLRW